MSIFIFKKIGGGNSLKSLLLALLLGVAGLMNAQNTENRGGDWYYYDDGSCIGSLVNGNNPNNHICCGIMFPSGFYSGNILTKVSIFNRDRDDRLFSGLIIIFNDGETAPQSPVASMNIETTPIGEFVEYTFNQPVQIDPTKNVWVIMDGTGCAPVCANTGNPNGRWDYHSGVWQDLVSLGLEGTFMIRAYIEDSAPSGNLSYNFEDGTLQGWTTIDSDGDGFNWFNYYGWGHNDSDHFASSESYDNATSTGLTPDNYLVSPQVELGGSISFWASAMDSNYPEEHFGVAVSTTNNTDPSAFTTLEEWTITAKRVDDRGQTEWVQYTVDLDAYAGHTGYVAIRHFGCTDQYMLNVDDIVITLGTDVVSEQNAMTLKVYPNPAKETLRIEGLEADATVEIYNSLGMMVKTLTASADEEINISNLTPGIYMLRCGKQTIRFVKE